MPEGLPFDDSRRLLGGNLFFAANGVVLETVGIDVDDALLAGWRTRVERGRRHLGWTRGDDGTAPPLVVRRHRGGASLAFAAPLDQLFTATELNEWALCATVHERDPARWANVMHALLEDYLADAATPADVIPPVLEEAAALERLARRAAGERRPDVVALVQEAGRRGVCHMLDETTLTLGAGTGGRGWPLDALPAPRDVPWDSLRTIPLAAVTGSNGKTTTVRLVAACLRAHGWRDGFNCTDGVFIARECVARGDYSGPAGTRRVLRDGTVEAAVLETARGGILRRGLAIDRADAAVVTNISNDHFGEFGIDDLEGLADVKLTVAQLVAHDGLLVLNADDALLRDKAATLPSRLGRAPALAWFALDFDRPELVAHRAAGGATTGVRSGQLLLSWHGTTHDLGVVSQLPLTVEGTATYNVANLAAAALVAAALGIAPATIGRVYAEFARDPADNAGRLMRFDRGGARFIVDYAHNPDGLRGLLQVARALRGPGGRLVTLLGHAGNRLDEDIAELARVAASFAPDVVVVKEDEGHLRGRQPGEVPAILRAALLQAGMPPGSVVMRGAESDAASHAIAMARPGDAVALLMHSSGAREAVLALLRDGGAR